MSFRVSPEGKIQRKVRIQSERTRRKILLRHSWHLQKIKSAAGIGALLLEGIGDTMRVSLTADPVEEVRFARELLESLGMRDTGFDLVSCPTCGRTKVDLESIALHIERALAALERRNLCPKLKIAVMGCAVNGPGEAKDADLGVACGEGKGVIFSKGEVLKTVKEEEIAEEIIKAVQSYGTI